MTLELHDENIYEEAHSFIKKTNKLVADSSMPLNPFVAPPPPPGCFSPFIILFTVSRRLHRKQNKHTDTHALSGIRAHNSTVRIGKDTSYLRLHGHHRQLKENFWWYMFEISTTDVAEQ
jgi:hypothetical protein